MPSRVFQHKHIHLIHKKVALQVEDHIPDIAQNSIRLQDLSQQTAEIRHFARHHHNDRPSNLQQTPPLRRPYLSVEILRPVQKLPQNVQHRLGQGRQKRLILLLLLRLPVRSQNRH